MTTRYPLVLNGTSIQELQNSDSLILPSALSISSGGTGLTSFTSGGVVYASSTSALATGSALTFDGTNLGVGTSSPPAKLVVSNAGAAGYEVNPTGGIGGGATVATYNRSTSAYTSLTTYASTMTWYSGSTRAMDLDASGNLGIGTSSSANRLSVFGANGSTTNGAQVRISNTTGTTRLSLAVDDASNKVWFVNGGSTTNPSFNWSTNDNNTALMTLDNSGNLGLGVTPSASWSSFWSAEQIGQAGTLFAYKSGSNYTVLTNNSYASGGSYQGGDAKYTNNGYSTAYIQNNSGQHLWMTSASGTAGNPISFTQAMTLTSASQLLIGSTSAAGSLDSGTLQVGSGFSGITNTGSVVAPTIVTSGSLEFNLDGVSGTQRHGRITGNGDTSAGAYAGGLTFEYYGFSGSAYQWYTGMTMSSVGTINTTSAASNAMNIAYNGSWTGGNSNFVTMYMPNMTGGTAGLALGKAGGTYNTSKIIFGYAGSGSSSNFLGLGFWDADSRFTLYPTGNASLTGTLTQNTSDDRLKTDFVVIKNALSKVRALSGFTHAWNDLAVKLNSADPTIRESGVSAQKVKEVLPEAVCIAPFDQVKGNRFASESGEDYLTVMYEKLVPLLIEAIKELDGEISILKTKQGV